MAASTNKQTSKTSKKQGSRTQESSPWPAKADQTSSTGGVAGSVANTEQFMADYIEWDQEPAQYYSQVPAGNQAYDLAFVGSQFK